jgi:C_GCAxxG_C_C family probable redox protein
MEDRMNRRDVLKLSVAAGVTLVTGGISKIADAATKEKNPSNKPEYAKIQYLKSLNCSQSILETYAPSIGISVAQARSVASAFAGGMGMGLECGAVTGAFMVIGMKCGNTADSDSRADNETFKRVAEFTKEFKARHKHINCSKLLETDMNTPEGLQKAASKGYFTLRCPMYVKSAAEILDKILAQ